MTFYKILGHRTLKEQDERADYLKYDLDWIRKTSEATFDLNLVEPIFESTVEKIREGERLSAEEARLAGAVFLGDSEFLNFNRDWFNHFPVRLLIRIGDSAAHHKYRRIAGDYIELRELSAPGFSLPEDYRISGEKITSRTSSFVQRAVLASTITSIDWLEYIFNEMDVEYRQSFLDNTRNQMAEFIVGESYELDSRVAEFQGKMFRANVEWMQQIEKGFDLDSMLADRVCGEFERIREERLEKF